jgi:hypothetical protein
VPLDPGAVAEPTLDAKPAMAEVVLRGAVRANRRRHGLPEEQGKAGGAAPARPVSWQNGAGELGPGRHGA